MINIKYLNDAGIATIKKNSSFIYDEMKLNPKNNVWIKKYLPNEYLINKIYKIIDFELLVPESGNMVKTTYHNAITLYENLNHLPRMVLTEERFWAWFNFFKYYDVALASIDLKTESAVKNHFLFGTGRRRGVFFGVLSRLYWAVELTIDDREPDKYIFTKYVLENRERIRNITWRAFSSQKKIVLGIVKAQMEAEKKYGARLKTKYFKQIPILVGKVGSVKLLDSYTEQEIYTITTKIIDKLINGEILS